MNNGQYPVLESGFNSILRTRREAFKMMPEPKAAATNSQVPEITRRQSNHQFVVLLPADLACKITKDVLQSADFAISDVCERKLVCFKETGAAVNMALEARFEQLPTGATKVIFCNFNYGIPTLHRSLIENNMRKLQRLIEMRIKEARLVRLGESAPATTIREFKYA